MEQEEKPVDKKKGRGGRKPKPPELSASRLINFRVTPAEEKILERQLQNSNYTTRSEMLHDIIFRQKLAQKDSLSVVLLAETQQVIREIKGIGANYNQVVKQINSLTNDQVLLNELKDLVRLTEEIQRQEQEFRAVLIKLREKWLQE